MKFRNDALAIGHDRIVGLDNIVRWQTAIAHARTTRHQRSHQVRVARKLAVDLSDSLVSARLLVPVDPDFPVLGGKTLRVSTGVEMAFRDARPVVVLKGVSIMGVPIPNAWLGGLKNIDLVSEFGDQQGFWKNFADGVDNVGVEEGQLRIQLRQ